MSRGRGHRRRDTDFTTRAPDTEKVVSDALAPLGVPVDTAPALAAAKKRMDEARSAMNRSIADRIAAPELPNPGYPFPRGVRLILAGDVVVKVATVFKDVVMDRGVPTPRFELVLPGYLEVSEYAVQRIEASYWPPGTILMFPQAGNPQENAERIVTLSRRAAFDKLMMTRKDNP